MWHIHFLSLALSYGIILSSLLLCYWKKLASQYFAKWYFSIAHQLNSTNDEWEHLLHRNTDLIIQQKSIPTNVFFVFSFSSSFFNIKFKITMAFEMTISIKWRTLHSYWFWCMFKLCVRPIQVLPWNHKRS